MSFFGPPHQRSLDECTRDLCQISEPNSTLDRKHVRNLIMTYHPDKAPFMTGDQKRRMNGSNSEDVSKIINECRHLYDTGSVPCPPSDEETEERQRANREDAARERAEREAQERAERARREQDAREKEERERTAREQAKREAEARERLRREAAEKVARQKIRAGPLWKFINDCGALDSLEMMMDALENLGVHKPSDLEHVEEEDVHSLDDAPTAIKSKILYCIRSARIAETERIAKEKAESERLAREKAEQERLDRERQAANKNRIKLKETFSNFMNDCDLSSYTEEILDAFQKHGVTGMRDLDESKANKMNLKPIVKKKLLKCIETIPHIKGESVKSIIIASEYDDRRLQCMVFSPDGQTIVTGDSRSLRCWNISSNSEKILDPKRGTNGVSDLKLSSDGRVLAILTSFNTSEYVGQPSVILWDTSTWEIKNEFRPPGRYPQHINQLCLSPDGRTIITGGGGPLRIWDALTGTLVKKMYVGTRNEDGIVNVSSFFLGPDGRTLFASVYGSEQSHTEHWDISTQKLIHSFDGDNAALSPDGLTLATTMCTDSMTLSYPHAGILRLNSIVKLWDVMSGNLKQTLEGHKNKIQSMCFSPDGFTLATCDGSINGNLMDTSTGNLKIINDDKGINLVQFNHDGRMLATGSSSKVKLWV